MIDDGDWGNLSSFAVTLEFLVEIPKDFSNHLPEGISSGAPKELSETSSKDFLQKFLEQSSQEL